MLFCKSHSTRKKQQEFLLETRVQVWQSKPKLKCQPSLSTINFNHWIFRFPEHVHFGVTTLGNNKMKHFSRHSSGKKRKLKLKKSLDRVSYLFTDPKVKYHLYLSTQNYITSCLENCSIFLEKKWLKNLHSPTMHEIEIELGKQMFWNVDSY